MRASILFKFSRIFCQRCKTSEGGSGIALEANALIFTVLGMMSSSHHFGSVLIFSKLVQII